MPVSAHLLIIDLEATCCDRGKVPRDEMEIIEIGAVLLDGKTLETVSEFGTFIKPVRHPVLTPFCTKLTTITRADVDGAPLFPEALAQLKAWLEPYPDCLFSSWGAYDRGQFLQDCAFHDLPFPFPEAHLNLKKAFAEAKGLKKRPGMGQALGMLGLELEGTHHRGIDDARNMTRIVARCAGDIRLEDPRRKN
jgi:inhibitor of KinA sporulation pathway (predicted exonuclease)